MAGLRVYFGNHDKTLIRRQREDDPPAGTSKAAYTVPRVKKIGSNAQTECLTVWGKYYTSHTTWCGGCPPGNLTAVC